MTVGLVLSGGGAKGDFEVGAARYLYEHNLKPSIIAGTSVGAINAIKLAEGEGDGKDATRGLKGLINIWRGLKTSDDMWKEEAWLTDIKNSDVIAFLKESTIEKVGSVGLELGKLAIPVVGPIWFAIDMFNTANDIEDLKNDLDKVVNGSSLSLYNLGPILAKLNDPSKLDLSKVQNSGIKMRLAVVALESGALRYVTESGIMLERDDKTPVMGPSYVLAPECRTIADSIKEMEKELLDFQDQLSGSAGTAKTGIIAGIWQHNKEISQLKSQLKSCNIAHPPQQVPLKVKLVQGTLASASIPLAFPPVALGSENYVDGGVRQIVPIQVAIQEGATDVYAIIASQSGVDSARSAISGKPLQSFDAGMANMADVANRAADDIMTNELVLNEIDPPNGWGVNLTVIQPDFDLHDIMTIDPGLIDIRMAHGYMRADDIIQAKQQNPADYRNLADEISKHQRNTRLIVQTRKAIWELEYAANGFLLKYDDNGRPVYPPQAIPVDLKAVEEVRKLKNMLRDQVHERQQAGGAVPGEIESWWSDWERHPWQPKRGFALPSGPAAAGDDAQPGEILETDHPINSANGLYTFVFQGDGNLVLYKNTKVTGALAPECQSIDTKIKELQRQIDNLHSQLGKSTSTSDRTEILGEIRQLSSQVTQSTNQLHDCNIAHPPQTTIQRQAIWASNTNGIPIGTCIMQADGNLVIYDTANQSRWSSNTWNNPGSKLVVQDDGNVVIYRPDGKPVWATATNR